MNLYDIEEICISTTIIAAHTWSRDSFDSEENWIRFLGATIFNEVNSGIALDRSIDTEEIPAPSDGQMLIELLGKNGDKIEVPGDDEGWENYKEEFDKFDGEVFSLSHDEPPPDEDEEDDEYTKSEFDKLYGDEGDIEDGDNSSIETDEEILKAISEQLEKVMECEGQDVIDKGPYEGFCLRALMIAALKSAWDFPAFMGSLWPEKGVQNWDRFPMRPWNYTGIVEIFRKYDPNFEHGDFEFDT